MFLQETDLNVVPGGIIPVMHVSQYDVGRELKFVLYDGYDTADITTGTTVTIEGTKPDGHGFQYSGVLDQNAHTATFVTTEQMTILAGAIECKLTLYLNSQRIGTALFILDVEKAGINDSTIISDTELPLIIAQATEQMERAEAAADAAALSETNAATSETNAATSETNAANSEIACGSFMRMAGASAASAEQSAIISGSFMRTAGNYADEAEASAASANVDALKSEGHALGTQNGTPVSSDSPYYHNNAKYWADEAKQSSAGGVAARVIATAEPTNISTHAYAIGDQFVYNGILYTATSAISVGETITPGTNCSISDTITEQIGNAGHTILDEDGVTYPQRSKLQFEGCEVTDDSTNDITKIKAEGGVTGVKGNAETDYRTGNVNLTPAHVGAVDEVEYEEDIHGVNLIPYPYYSTNERVTNGITFTVNDDLSITANGTATADALFMCANRNPSYDFGIKLNIGTSYILTGCPSGGSNSTYFLRSNYAVNGVAGIAGTDVGNGAEFEAKEIDNPGYGVYITIVSGTTVSNLTFRPMLRKATIQDDTYRPYNQQSIQNQITEQTNVLGAKNWLPYPYKETTKTLNGHTFTVNTDGTVVCNSVNPSAEAFLVLFQETGSKIKEIFGSSTSLRLTGCPIGGGNYNAFYIRLYASTPSYTAIVTDIGNGTQFNTSILDDSATYKISIKIDSLESGVTRTFKPMLRLASDPDDTYVPYAMTNRELTENITDTYQTVKLSESVSVTADGTTNLGGLLDQLRSALTTYLSGISSDEVCKITNLNIPNYSGALTCRDSYYNITNNSSGFSPTFYGIAHSSNAIRNHFVLMRSSGSIAIAGNINASGSSYEVGTSKVLTSGTVITVYLDKYKKI